MPSSSEIAGTAEVSHDLEEFHGCYFSSRESRRSLRIRPSVWQCGQYVIT